MRTKVRSAAGLIALFAAGVSCAQALGQVPVPLPTVSVPSVSVPVQLPPPPLPPTPPTPLPPAPPPPALPSAPPTPPAPSPHVSAPSEPAAGPPESPSAPPEGPASSSGYSYFAEERSREPAGSASSANRMGVSRLQASARRFGPGTKRRGTRITFRLSTPARVVFVVRGPAPSCAIVGRFTVRGRAGVNRVRFKGKIGRRTLATGTYAIAVRGVERFRRVVLIVGPQPRARFDCSDAGNSVLAAALPDFGPPAAAEPARSAGKESRGVLPTITKKIRTLPEAIPAIPRPSIPREPADAPPMLVGLAALALTALSAIVIVAYVIRFLRGPRTKSA